MGVWCFVAVEETVQKGTEEKRESVLQSNRVHSSTFLPYGSRKPLVLLAGKKPKGTSGMGGVVERVS